MSSLPVSSLAVQPLPPVSLIVCSRNRPDLLQAAVASVLAGHELPAEFIVVDQSGEPNAALVGPGAHDGCEIRYLWQPDRGLSRACNVGIAAARHERLVFLHDDVLVPPDWFGNIVRAMLAAGPRAIVTGRVLPSEAETEGGFVPTLIEAEDAAVYRGRVGEDVLYPLNMAMHRSLVQDVGPFDERLGPGTPFPAAEDNDFGLRALEAGFEIHYVPAAMLYHRAWRGDRLALRWSYGRGQGAYYAKHLSFRDRYMLRRFAHDVWRHGRVAQILARRDREVARSSAVYAAALLSGAAEWLWTYRRAR